MTGLVRNPGRVESDELLDKGCKLTAVEGLLVPYQIRWVVVQHADQQKKAEGIRWTLCGRFVLTGSINLSALKFILLMFISGLNKRHFPSASLYAFIPSNKLGA